MTRNLVPTLIIIISIALFFFVVDDQFIRLSALLSDRAQALEAEDEFEQLKATRRELNDRAETAADDYEEIEKFLPDERNDARTAMTIQAAAEDNDLSFDNLSVEGGADQVPTDLDLAEDRLGIKHIQVQFNTPLEDMMGFVEQLAESLRQYDVTAIRLEPRDIGVHDMSLVIQTYWVR